MTEFIICNKFIHVEYGLHNASSQQLFDGLVNDEVINYYHINNNSDKNDLYTLLSEICEQKINIQLKKVKYCD